MAVTDFIVHERRRDLVWPSYGAKCSGCGAWLTKYDFDRQEAAENAKDALRTHTCISDEGERA